MEKYEGLFSWPDVHLHHFYIYFAFAFGLAFYIVYTSKAKNKVELFFLCFFLLTGQYNEMLTISIPGFKLFEIQPVRFLYLMFLFYLVRKVLFTSFKPKMTIDGKVPWYEIMLYAYIVLLIVSQFANVGELKVSSILKNVLNAFGFLFIIFSVRMQLKHFKVLKN